MLSRAAVAAAALALGAGCDTGSVGSQQGYEPVQPIAYSHATHAGELKIDCQYCHFGAGRSRHAGVPPARVWQRRCRRSLSCARLGESSAAMFSAIAKANLQEMEIEDLDESLFE